MLFQGRKGAGVVVMNTREEMFREGSVVLNRWCELNKIKPPAIETINRESPYFDRINTCAFYRPHTIRIMVEKCASKGYGGRAWSWPGYTVDRTPYGVLQHELGHHVDNHFFDGNHSDAKNYGGVFSKRIYDQSGEPPLTGYLGTDSRDLTFWMEPTRR